MGFQDVDRLDGVGNFSTGFFVLDILDSTHNHFWEEVALWAQKFGGHGGLGRIYECILPQSVHLDAHIVLNEFYRLTESQPVTCHYWSGVNFVLNEVISSLQELCCQNDYRGGTVSHLSILDLGQLHENFGCGVLDLKLFKDSGAVISDCDISDVVDEHFVEALRA